MANQSASSPAPRKRLRILRTLLKWLVMLLFAAAALLVVIMSQPQVEAHIHPDASQPVLSAARAVSFTTEAELNTVSEAFPIPVLTSVGGSLRLVTGLMQDFPFEGGYGRLLQTQWEDRYGNAITLYTIYPARATDALPGGWALMGEGPSLAGQRSIYMATATQARLHTQTAEGLYAVCLPRLSTEEMVEVIQPLQLK